MSRPVKGAVQGGLFASGTRTLLGRVVAAGLRGEFAARRITLRDAAEAADLSSHNYLAIRLRDEKPLTLDDLAKLADMLNADPIEFIATALAKHGDYVRAIAAKQEEHPS